MENIMSAVEVKVPDIGDFKEVEVIELMVKVGDTIKVDQSLITVESDKASMEIPSSHAGVVKEVRVKVGDKVALGSLLVIVDAADASAAPIAPAAVASAPVAVATPATPAVVAPAPVVAVAAAPVSVATATAPAGKAHASPSIRKFARELGVDLSKVAGTAPKGRITQQDVQNFVKGIMSGTSVAPVGPTTNGSGAGLNLLPWPSLDFSKFGTARVSSPVRRDREPAMRRRPRTSPRSRTR